MRVTVIDKEQKPRPNREALEIVKRVKELQKDMRFTDDSKTREMLRDARNGGMFGDEIDEWFISADGQNIHLDMRNIRSDPQNNVQMLETFI